MDLMDVGILAGLIVLGQKLADFGIEWVKARRAKNGHAPTQEAKEHPLQPQLKAIHNSQAHLEEKVDRINRTLNGNGRPEGGLVAIVQTHAHRLLALEEAVRNLLKR